MALPNLIEISKGSAGKFQLTRQLGQCHRLSDSHPEVVPRRRQGNGKAGIFQRNVSGLLAWADSSQIANSADRQLSKPFTDLKGARVGPIGQPHGRNGGSQGQREQNGCA